MKNYICVNDHHIELTDEQVERIVAACNNQTTMLSEIAVGEVAKIGNYEFVVLEHDGDTTAVILKDFLSVKEKFGKNNNYNGSIVDEKCCAFANEIADIVGTNNIVPHEVDLTANDGLREYCGDIKRNASLLTADRYRRYVEILDNFKMDKWWWLSTPFSTKRHGYDSSVLCVAPSGFVSGNSCINGGIGVRPFCILKSNIFVSK